MSPTIVVIETPTFFDLDRYSGVAIRLRSRETGSSDRTVWSLTMSHRAGILELPASRRWLQLSRSLARSLSRARDENKNQNNERKIKRTKRKDKGMPGEGSGHIRKLFSFFFLFFFFSDELGRVALIIVARLEKDLGSRPLDATGRIAIRQFVQPDRISSIASRRTNHCCFFVSLRAHIYPTCTIHIVYTI